MLQIKNLSKNFIIHILDEKIIEGFNDISFTVPDGKSIGISGPSGAGKSSVLKCIYRTYKTTSGEIHYESSQFGNVELSNAPEHIVLKIRENEISYITQFLRIIPRVPCVDVVAEPLINHGVPLAEAREKAREILTRLAIPSKLFSAYPSTFSGGEQQRVNISRAVIRPPRLLLLDEPTASLDSRSTGIVLDILRELRGKGTTMIGVFHDNITLREFSDSVYEMPAGKI